MVFVNYRRADAPYAAAVVTTILDERFGDHTAFLDTLLLSQRARRSVEELPPAVEAAPLVLAVCGPAWDSADHVRRLREEGDWVRKELQIATDAGLPIVPVLVDRLDVPSLLQGRDRLLVGMRDVVVDPVCVDRRHPWAVEDVLVGRVGEMLGRAPRPKAARDAESVQRAALAMVRHVLPPVQNDSRNDEMVARVLASVLETDAWLEHASTANLRGKPTGSAVLHLTRESLGVTQVTPKLVAGEGRSWARSSLQAVERRCRRRLGLREVTDLTFHIDGGRLEVRGVFRDRADELLDRLGVQLLSSGS